MEMLEGFVEGEGKGGREGEEIETYVSSAVVSGESRDAMGFSCGC